MYRRVRTLHRFCFTAFAFLVLAGCGGGSGSSSSSSGGNGGGNGTTPGNPPASGTLTVSIEAPELAGSQFLELFLFRADGRMVGTRFNQVVPAALPHAIMLYVGASDVDNISQTATPVLLPEGPYTLLLLSDAGNNGRLSDNADDTYFLGEVAVSGDTTFTLTATERFQPPGLIFAPMEAAVANRDFFCVFHLPGFADPWHDAAQRSLFGWVSGTTNASGGINSGFTYDPAVAEALDLTCIADAHGDLDWDMGTGLGSGDAIATETGVTPGAGAGVIPVSGFVAVP